MDIASSYLDYEICLSRRSDLIPAVLAHVLHARLPECIEAELHVCAHEVRNAEIVTLRFLIEERSAAPQRNRLIVGGEMLLDKLFAASPWQSAPMVMEATSKRPVRPEIHVKCRPTDEEIRKTFDYTSIDHTPFRNTVEDILTQLFGHSWYHRGQIAMLVRASGGQPAITDLIYWSREPIPGV